MFLMDVGILEGGELGGNRDIKVLCSLNWYLTDVDESEKIKNGEYSLLLEV